MRALAHALLVLGALVLATPLAAQSRTALHHIAGGTFTPFYSGATGAAVEVAPFDMDEVAVTNAQFLAFVRTAPRWQRGSAPALFVDSQYLSHWTGPMELGPSAGPAQPVTFVSWYAARAYCGARDMRLPTEAEWELAARADARLVDAHRDPAFVERILAFYTRPHAALADVGQGEADVHGIRELHGLVWEWVEDFNASMVSADDRSRGDAQSARFCGGASLGAEDVADYAAFMRYAFRSSLRASYTVHNLGFRCVRSAAASGEAP